MFAAWSLALVAASGLVVRYYARTRRTELGQIETLRQAVAQFPETLRTLEHPILFVGSSHIRAGIIPATFDRAYQEKAGAKRDAMTLGFNGLASECLVQVSAWIADELAAHPQRDVVFTEFNPLAATHKWNAMPVIAPYMEGCLAIGAPARFFISELTRSATRATRLLAYRWFTEGATPRELTADVRRLVFPQPSWWPVPAKPPSKGLIALRALVAKSGPGWTHEARGGRLDQIGDPELAPHLEVLASPQAHKATLDRRERMGGITEYDIAAVHVDREIASIRELQRSARQVVVLVTPVEFGIIKESNRGAANRSAAIDRIRRETGVCVIDLYASAAFTSADFEDVDHLSRVGADKYSRMLADKLAVWEAAGRRACTGLE